MIRYGAAGYTLLKVARDPDRSRMRRLLETAAAGLPATARARRRRGATAGARAPRRSRSFPTGATRHSPGSRIRSSPRTPRAAQPSAARAATPSESATRSTHIATFRALLDAQALDVLRLDVPALGGITPGRHVQALAAERGVPVSLHIYPEVSVHLATLRPGAIVETFDPELPGGNPLDPAHVLCSGGPAFRDGMAVAPEAPGLGFELDWARFRA